MVSRLQKGMIFVSVKPEDKSYLHRDLFYKDVPLFKKQSVVDKVCRSTFNTHTITMRYLPC